MKILAESNCARKYRRLTSPMNVSLGHKVYSVTNWSPGGMLVPTQPGVLEKGRVEDGELLIPCSDGVFLMRVQVLPLHQAGEAWGCRFVDMPPRERAIFHFYADAITRGLTLSITQLEESGKLTSPDAQPSIPASLKEAVEVSWFRSLFQMSGKRVALILGMLVIIALVGSFVVPHFAANLMQKKNAKAEYLRAAKTRLQNGELSLSDLGAKIEIVRGLLGGGNTANSTVNPEQSRILELGLRQLETEKEVLTEHVNALRSDIESTEQSRFFFINPFLRDSVETRSDPAPYVTAILRDLSSPNGLEPRGQVEIDKYLLIAESRVKQAEISLSSAKVKRESLERIVKRVNDAGSAAGFPQNQLDLMKRDAELLRLEEERLTDMLRLLNDNVAAVKAGNFIYETKLLQRFDSQPVRSVDSTESNLVR